jgi:hypothetical protein
MGADDTVEALTGREFGGLKVGKPNHIESTLAQFRFFLRDGHSDDTARLPMFKYASKGPVPAAEIENVARGGGDARKNRLVHASVDPN